MSEDTTVAVLEQPTSSAERPVKPAVQTWQHGFWSLVVTQFQGAFNDNDYKNLVVFLILGTGLAKADRDRLLLQGRLPPNRRTFSSRDSPGVSPLVPGWLFGDDVELEHV